MTSSESKLFREFLQDSFKDGVSSRELRLSSEELEHLRNMYPKASWKPVAHEELADGKSWFEVTVSDL
ncbi:MAG: hypothetical protein ACM3PP_05865 [Candidatus Saccharibacteria bacterium]